MNHKVGYIRTNQHINILKPKNTVFRLQKHGRVVKTTFASLLQSIFSETSTIHKTCFCPAPQGTAEFHTSAHPKGDGLKRTEGRGNCRVHAGILALWVRSWTHSCGEPGGHKEGRAHNCGHLIAPGTHGRRQERQRGLGACPSSIWGAHDPTCTPFITSPLSRSCVSRGALTQAKSPQARWQQRLQQKQGSEDPGGTKSRDKQGMEPPLLQGRWRLERANSQIQPEAAQVKETKNLNDCATYWRKSNSYSAIQHQLRNTWSTTTKTHSDTVPQKDSDSSPETKGMECFNLTVKEFKIAVAKKFNEQWERQFNELMNKVNEQKEYFT